jgi:gamma-glutamyltranspeptidase
MQFLLQSVVLGKSLDASLNAPRIHTEGNQTVEFEMTWLENETAALKTMSYNVKTAGAATLSAVARENGVMRAAMR